MAKVEDGDFEDIDDDFDNDFDDDDLNSKIGRRIDIKFRNWAKHHPDHVIIDGNHGHSHRWYRHITVNNDMNFYGLGIMLSAGITWYTTHQDVWTTIWHGLLSWLYFGYWLAQQLH